MDLDENQGEADESYEGDHNLGHMQGDQSSEDELYEPSQTQQRKSPS